MTDKNIDDQHHILRWVPKNKLRHDPETNAPIGPDPLAFRLRVELKPIPETYLSVSWVEHVAGERDAQIRTTANLLAAQVKTTPAKGGAFAIGQAGAIKAECKSSSNIDAKIISTPGKKKPAYAQVWGIPYDDLTLQTALAFGCWSSIVKAVDVLDPTT